MGTIVDTSKITFSRLRSFILWKYYNMAENNTSAGSGDNNEIEDDTTVDKGKKVAKHDSGTADLEKVTDYAEEIEITSNNMADAMRVVNDRQSRDAAEKIQLEKELSKIKITTEDVEFIVRELEISHSVAERKLREHRGNVVEAVIALTN